MEIDKDMITVGQLAEDLAEFEEEYSDWDVVCWTPNGAPCYLNVAELDEDGDLCLSLDEDGDGTFDVATLLGVLDEYDDDTCIYVAARGLFLDIEEKPDTTVFEEDCDEESDIEIVACRGSVFGEYEDGDWDDNEE